MRSHPRCYGYGMKKPPALTLERVTITEAPQHITIKHKATGAVCEVDKHRLDAWCITQLRLALTTPGKDAIK